MRTSQRNALTVAEAARQLGVSVEELLELVYSGEIAATVQRETGRLLLVEADVERWGSRGGLQGRR